MLEGNNLIVQYNNAIYEGNLKEEKKKDRIWENRIQQW